jgi:hypothetical protein
MYKNMDSRLIIFKKQQNKNIYAYSRRIYC